MTTGQGTDPDRLGELRRVLVESNQNLAKAGLEKAIRGEPPPTEREAMAGLLAAALAYEPRRESREPGSAVASPEARRALWRRLAGAGFDAAPGLVQDVILALAEDPSWETRETGAALAGDVLAAHFDTFYPTVLALAASPSENTRRAAALAVMYASKRRNPAWVERILDVLERLLADRAVYVRKNLGPFAIGSALLLRHPAETLARLAKWAQSADEQVLWNVAMAFSAAPAKAHVPEALAILGPLSGHPSRFVWRAAASSLRFLGRHDPDRVLPALEAWSLVPERRKTVETVMGYLRSGG